MPITLKWSNPNPGQFTTRIFRSESEFTPATAPSVAVAELTAGETIWVDASVSYGDTRYYMLEVSNGASTKRSAVIKATATLVSRGPSTPLSSMTTGNYYESYGYYTAVALQDGLNAEIQRLLGATYSNTYYLYKIGNRTFFAPERDMQVNTSKMIENGLLFGGRAARLPAGKTKADYGGDKTFMWRGKRYACGLPNVLRPQASTPDGNPLNYVDANGFVTHEKLAESEVMLMATQQHVYLNDYRIPNEQNSSLFTNTLAIRNLVSCDADLNLDANGNLQLYRAATLTGKTLNIVPVPFTGLLNVTPVFECLGAA